MTKIVHVINQSRCPIVLGPSEVPCSYQTLLLKKGLTEKDFMLYNYNRV